ncbi:LAMI_0G00848g1_1 [Lachancea mirantina]|uniref:DNA repair and recombination protein RDH54 n=1 Tax=Lachancea mirantina TaxID=1230905 RepID=A0A1G4K7A4_9SACH|nr:LAMI_0G00848g1_1 [Lachancea mirantina]
MKPYQNKPFKRPRPLSSLGEAPSQVMNPKLDSNRGNGGATKEQSVTHQNPSTAFYTMTYRKKSMKKNKTWDGDGYGIESSPGVLKFYSDAGKKLGTAAIKDRDILFDTVFPSSGQEFQLDYCITSTDELQAVQQILKVAGPLAAAQCGKKDELPSLKSQRPSSRCVPTTLGSSVTSSKPPIFPRFKSAMKGSENGARKNAASSGKYLPLHDPSTVENALVMNKLGTALVDVVVDPLLSRFLRPHQRIGVKFLYDCVMQLSRPDGLEDDATEGRILGLDSDLQGCILADEMGLGKTLMAITLIWTLLKQAPRPTSPLTQKGYTTHGVVDKVLIVCPVTLISNWKNEFSKWLNLNRIGVLTLSSKNTTDKDKSDVRNFFKIPRTFQVLILGYEKLHSVYSELEESRSDIGLLICDEGHRLKNSQSKTLIALTNLDVSRKVLLSGTPIQNDLTEFYTIINFVNPGVLGSFSNFKRKFINSIYLARDVKNRLNPYILERGDERSKELLDITKKFILRRTQDILEKYLPPKTDAVVFCKPQKAQIQAFQAAFAQSNFDFDQITFKSSLALITLFKKICNFPSLISSSHLPRGPQMIGSSRKDESGKFRVLTALISEISKIKPDEKVVIVSNYTQTLDVIQSWLTSEGFTFLRLDGATPNKLRQQMVDSFNNTPVFCFLLSAKSGGVGLNLTGASRLILFDNDWNPSVDLQAMSRIHRDGQKKHCYIYRLLTTGCIDEKIFQRQLMKHNLSKKFLGDGTSGAGESDDNVFEIEDLKDLFTVHETTVCNTHELICSCDGSDTVNVEDFKTASVIELQEEKPYFQLDGWTSALELQQNLENSEASNLKKMSAILGSLLKSYIHINPKKVKVDGDQILNSAMESSDQDITFVLLKNSNAGKKSDVSAEI